MIGRKKEQAVLSSALTSNKSELIALIGRRRVGKTFLVRQFFQGKLDFELTGLQNGNKEQQLRNFSYRLRAAKKTTAPITVPIDWLDAFHQLEMYCESLTDLDRKKVIFIDELPWIATPKSDFLTGFGYFWNSYASRLNSKIIVVICGSATAWMIKHIVNNKGGLHNRVTRKINLAPFSLMEVKDFFISKHIHFDHYQIVQLYMTMGGIPHYLDHVEKGKSAIQNIDAICFHSNGFLRTEFDNLYSSLFNHPERYEAIITILASTWKGMSRAEIVKKAKLKDGGNVTNILKELEQSGFITAYYPFNKKKKNSLYRLTDNYSLFYLKFIQNTPPNNDGQWLTLSQTQSWKSWSGYAFENICLQHIQKIKEALGIGRVHTQQCSFVGKTTENKEGVQIDLLIDRQDNVISLCEIKFYNDEMTLTKSYANALRKKRSLFRQITKTKKHTSIALITTYGLTENQHSIGLIDSVLEMKDLF